VHEGQDVFVAVEPQELDVAGVKDVAHVLFMECYLLQNSELHVYPVLVQSALEVT